MQKKVLLFISIFLVTLLQAQGYRVESNYNYVGVLDSTGAIALPFKYKAIQATAKPNRFIVVRKGKAGVRDHKNKKVIPEEYEHIGDAFIQNSLVFYVIKEGKVGLLDDKGNLLIPIIYTELFEHKDGLFGAKKEQYGVINTKGEVVLPFQYQSIEAIYSSLFRTQKNNQYGIADFQGNSILPEKYTKIEMLEGMFKVQQEDNYGLVSTTGETLLPVEYSVVAAIKDYYMVKQKGKYGIMYKGGISLVPIEYDGITFIGDGFKVLKENKVGVYSLQGKRVLPVEYQNIISEKGYLGLEADNNQYGIASRQGHIVLNPVYQWVGVMYQPHSEDINQAYIFVQHKQKYGIYSWQGTQLLPPQYTKIEHCTANKFIIEKEGKKQKLILDNEALLLTPFKNKKEEAQGCTDF